eukprot:4079596-Pleurochrysis_carterae.AAC.1
MLDVDYLGEMNKPDGLLGQPRYLVPKGQITRYPAGTVIMNNEIRGSEVDSGSVIVRYYASLIPPLSTAKTIG